MKLIAVLMFACVSIFSETLAIEWAISPKKTACFAQKVIGKDVKFVGMEWAEFVKKHEYCYVKKWYGWSKVKTAKMDKTDWHWPSGGNAQWPTHTPPYRRGSTELIIVTPTISKEPHKK